MVRGPSRRETSARGTAARARTPQGYFPFQTLELNDTETARSFVLAEWFLPYTLAAVGDGPTFQAGVESATADIRLVHTPP
jgi:hypothetical protein